MSAPRRAVRTKPARVACATSIRRAATPCGMGSARMKPPTTVRTSANVRPAPHARATATGAATSASTSWSPASTSPWAAANWRTARRATRTAAATSRSTSSSRRSTPRSGAARAEHSARVRNRQGDHRLRRLGALALHLEDQVRDPRGQLQLGRQVAVAPVLLVEPHLQGGIFRAQVGNCLGHRYAAAALRLLERLTELGLALLAG